MSPEEKKCFVTRSKCWLQLGNAENALTDAEEALRLDKEYIPVSCTFFINPLLAIELLIVILINLASCFRTLIL